MPTLRPIIAALSLLLLTLSCAHAATLNVPTSQYPTIQAGINAAAPGDTVLVADGTYTGPGNVDLDFGGKNITVTSVNGAAKTIIDCQGSENNPHRGFYFHNGETAAATISGFTVENGEAAPDAQYPGGGVSIINSSPTLTNCAFTGNQSYAVFVASSATITNCTFNGNLSNVIYVGYSGSVAVANCTFTNNGFGGIQVYGKAAVANSVFISTYGDAMYVVGTASATGCTFTGGQHNGITGDGGSSLTVTGCAFTGNQGNGLITYSVAEVANCAFVGNKDNGISIGDNTSITNCAFAANGNDGISIGDNSTIINCTMTANQRYAIEFDGSGSGSILTNCILWNDSVAHRLTGSGSVGEVGFNAAGANVTLSHCDVQGGYAGTGNINADPLFVRNPNLSATPPDYGDLHLRPGSPCLGAGTAMGAPTTDKDGTLRPNPPSIGAYEVTSAPIPGRFDFNMDGSNDLLWHNTSTGQTLVWNMSDQNVTTYGSPFATVPNTDWTVAATADVNGDGHPDLLWENTRTGQVLFWLMGGTNGQQVISYGSPFATVADTHWRVVSMADFNGDGHPDMLWQNNATNQLVIWYLNGTSVVNYGAPFATVSDTHWQVAGVADFDGDGHPDLLWENSATGQVLVWNLGGGDGTSVLRYGSAFATVPNTAWRVVGTGDMNGDGHPDLVWQNVQTGQVLRWLMGGAGGMQVQAYGSPFAVVPDTHWQIVGVH